MQVRPLFVAALLAVTAIGAMADEFDRGDQLQAQNQQSSTVTRAEVKAEARQAVANGDDRSYEERSDGILASKATAPASHLTRAQVEAQVAAYRATHKSIASQYE